MKIGILHPGEMGAAIAASACNSGMDVYWCSEGRSAATLERANSLGLNALPSLQSLCDTCDLLISVCPPHAALELAELVMACNFQGIYADVNAVSPTTVTTIASKLEKAGIEVVDGGIIGLPPVTRGTTWLYLSGKTAATVMDCFDAGPLETEVLSDRIGQASGLKICFAANSKGKAALHTAILAAADNMGVRDALENQWDIFNPGFTAKSHGRIRQVARKSWRFTGEMKEIAATLESNGLPREFFDAAAEIYERQITFKDVEKEPAIEAILEMVKASRNTS
ncbi:MAG: DUF1932 domain-containing protein [Pseudohongiellaceae bacterium]